MSKHRGSFLMRCWRFDDDRQRIELEHVQSGETYLAHSVAEAVDWACAHIGSADDPPVPIVVLTTLQQSGEE